MSPPFHSLEEWTFQRLCRDLFEQEKRIATCSIFGQRGQGQYGIDLLANRESDIGIEVGQCKCYSSIKESDIQKASDEFFKHWEYWKEQGVKRFILFAAPDVDRRQLQETMQAQRIRFNGVKIKYELWSASTLSQ